MVHTGITHGVLIVGGGILAALLVIELFRRWLRPADLEKASGLVGSILASGGTFYGILLGFVVVDCLGIQRFAFSLAASVIAFNLHLVMLFGAPFAGELSVSRRPCEIDIDIFDGLYDRQPAHATERSAISD